MSKKELWFPVALIVLLLLIGTFCLRRANAQEACATHLVTAYAQSDFPGTTASGRPTAGNVGVIVAEGNGRNSIWPFGQWIWIESVGSRMVADRGGGLTSGHIDLLVQTRAEALRWGRQHLQVCIGSSEE